MAVQTRRATVEEFDQFVQLPENADRLFEYVGGEITEVVSNNYSSEIAARILIEIGIYVKSRNVGRVTGADGGYRVSGERYIPDVAFISREKQPEPSHEAYNPTPPDLAVEVLSPSNDLSDIRIKLVNYLNAGTVVWIVDPDKKQVEVYASGQAKKLGLNDTLDGGAVLPGFTLPVKEIFPD
jgi:Uma2 family endonuclease